MSRRLVHVVQVVHHAPSGPLPSGHGVTVTVVAHPWVPRWMVLRAARAHAWSDAARRDPAALTRRETPGRPIVWEITWFPRAENGNAVREESRG